MDARAYLQGQGWQGDGHSLDHTGRGIKKPLLVSKKVDVLGVGVNKHQAVSDQWWLRAYDQGLTDFGTGKQSLLGQVQKHGIAMGGLYGRFVKGEGVAGTFGESLSSTPVGTITPSEGEQDFARHVAAASGKASPPLKRKRDDEELLQKRAKQKTKQDNGDDDKVKKLLGKAQRRGLVPSKSGNAIDSSAARSDLQGDLARIMATLSASSVFNDSVKMAAVGNDKTRKRAREAAKREFKRVARNHLGLVADMTQDDTVSDQILRKGGMVGIVVDTKGDDALKAVTADAVSVVTASLQEGDYATARSNIASQTPFSFVNTNGKKTFTWAPGDPLPDDPEWCADADVKALPRSIREARRKWMATQREECHGTSVKANKPKEAEESEKKIEAREALVSALLEASRKACAAGNDASMISKVRREVGGVPNVPLIKITSRHGGFDQDEIKAARRVARRVLKHAKKVERAEKDARRTKTSSN